MKDRTRTVRQRPRASSSIKVIVGARARLETNRLDPIRDSTYRPGRVFRCTRAHGTNVITLESDRNYEVAVNKSIARFRQM